MIARVLRLPVLAAILLASAAGAHEVRPAFLQVEESAPGTYGVVWKVPSNGGRVLDIRPEFDERLTLTQAGVETLLDGFVVYRYRLTGGTGLPGSSLTIRNLENTTVDVLARVNLLEGGSHAFLLNPKSPSAAIPAAPSKWQVVATYTKLGIEHILMGIDHLLFVVSLMLLVSGWWMLVQTITAFTVAHSITLALATLGFVSVPTAPVEAMIALSIVLVSVEAVRLRRGETSLAIHWPWLVAFAFGLLHGFGFAGALTELGLPQGDVPLALLFFNVGVELGQIVFIGAILAVLACIRRLLTVPAHAPVAAAYAIGSVAAFWFFQRLS
jgi:hypothetical protein